MKRARLSRATFPVQVHRVPFKFGTVAFSLRGSRGSSVVVSKRVAQSAVARNRIKRRLYAALQRVPVSYPGSVVLYPKAPVLSAQFSDIVESLTEAFQRH